MSKKEKREKLLKMTGQVLEFDITSDVIGRRKGKGKLIKLVRYTAKLEISGIEHKIDIDYINV